jgi:hypothetical protein
VHLLLTTLVDLSIECRVLDGVVHSTDLSVSMPTSEMYPCTLGRGGHSIFFSLFAIDGSITFSLLIDFDKSMFLGIFMFASSINRCFQQVTKN